MTDDEYKEYIKTKNRNEVEEILRTIDVEKYPVKMDLARTRLNELIRSGAELEPEAESYPKLSKFVRDKRIYRLHEAYIFIATAVSIYEAFDIAKSISLNQLGQIACSVVTVLIIIFYRKKPIVYKLLYIWWIPQLIAVFKETDILRIDYYNAWMALNWSVQIGFRHFYIGFNFLPLIAFFVLRVSKQFYEENKT